MQLTEEQIAEYLRENLQFFDRHSDLLANMRLPNPHGSGVISLAERQLLAHRDKARVLESRLDGYINIARDNELIEEKVHRLCLQLLEANSFESLIQVLVKNLREGFSVPYVGIRLWTNTDHTTELTGKIFQSTEDDLKQWVCSLQAPYCGLKPDLALDSLFDEEDLSEPVSPKSFAFISLGGHSNAFGLLALATNDEKHFHPEMGTLYLKRIGELVSAALKRYLA